MIAKAPVGGRSKTRLSPPCTREGAAAIAEAMLCDTLRAVATTEVRRRVLILEGDPGTWLPKGFEVIPQRGRGLAERVAAAFDDVGGPALLIGMDTPQVTPDTLESALATLRSPGVDAVLGEANDGGYWAIGLGRPDQRVFLGVPMSVPETAGAQRARLIELGSVVEELPRLRDVDTFDDAVSVAAAVPGSAFAAAVADAAGSAALRADALEEGA